MSLDITIGKTKELHSLNITHNLGKMAEEAGIYRALWRPEELFAKPRCKDVLPLLAAGLLKLRTSPNYFKKFNASNGYGVYENLVSKVEEYIRYCKKYRTAMITVSR